VGVLVGSLAIFLILMAMHETSDINDSMTPNTSSSVNEATFGQDVEEVSSLLTLSKKLDLVDDGNYTTRSNSISATDKKHDDRQDAFDLHPKSRWTRTNPALSPQLILIYLMFFVKRTGILSLQIFTWQYISVQFQLRLAQVANIQVAGALSMAFMTIVVLPLVCTLSVRKYAIRPVRLDQGICVASALIFAGGFALIYAANSIHEMYYGKFFKDIATTEEADFCAHSYCVHESRNGSRGSTTRHCHVSCTQTIHGKSIHHHRNDGRRRQNRGRSDYDAFLH